MNLIIENVVVIDGKEVLIESLPDKEKWAEQLNTEALQKKNYILEETA